MTEYLSPQVSIIQNLNQVIDNQPIEDILKKFATDKVKNIVLPVRKLKQEGNKEEYKKKKEKLLAVTFSGMFEGGTKAECLKKYSKVVILDIDNLEADEILNHKSQISNLKFTYACFISPGGLGLKVLVRVDNDACYHRIAFNEVKQFYENLLNKSIDKSGVNVNRLCFISYDPELYYNPNSEIFKTYIQMLNDDILKVVNQIEEQGIDLTVHYTDWHKICLSLISALGENSRSLFHRVSWFYPKYNYDECDKLFDDCLRYGSQKVTIKSFFWFAKQAGLDISPVESVDMSGYSENTLQNNTQSSQSNTNFKNAIDNKLTEDTQINKGVSEEVLPNKEDSVEAKPDKESKQEKEEKEEKDNKIEEYLNNVYDFRYNEITGRTEISFKGKEKFLAMTDFMINSIQRELIKNKIKSSVTGLRNKFCSDFCIKYDPIKEYFKKLSA